jgi:OOP family OmpA-OmpF porin
MMKSAAVAILLILLVVAPSAHGAGLYVGGSLGASFVKWDWEDVDEEDFKLEGADFAYKLFGGYKVIPFLSVEGGYRDLGKVTDGIQDVIYAANTNGWDIEAMGILPLGVAHLWAKAGYFFWSNEGSWGNRTESDNGSDFMWGLGGDLSILMIAVRVEWEKFEIQNTDHVSMFSGGVTFGF